MFLTRPSRRFWNRWNRTHLRNTAAGPQFNGGKATCNSKHSTNLRCRRPHDQSFTTIRGVTLRKSPDIPWSWVSSLMNCVLDSFRSFLTEIAVQGDHKVDYRDSWARYKISKSQIGIIYSSNIQKSYWYICF